MAGKSVNPNGLNSGDLFQRIRAKFGGKEYAVLGEVGNATGARTNRHADAVAMSLWPSRGLELHGFEIKISKGDLKRELEEPAKAEAIAKYCQRWWIVAPLGVTTPDEMPASWGLLEEYQDGLRIAKQAPLNESAEPLARDFIAALLRRFSESHVSRDSIACEVEAARRRGKDDASFELEYARRELKELREAADTFEKLSGVDIKRGWMMEPCANAVKILSRHDLPEILSMLNSQAEVITRLATQFGKAIEELKAMSAAPAKSEVA